jgi:hypothetical protein
MDTVGQPKVEHETHCDAVRQTIRTTSLGSIQKLESATKAGYVATGTPTEMTRTSCNTNDTVLTEIGMNTSICHHISYSAVIHASILQSCLRYLPKGPAPGLASANDITPVLYQIIQKHRKIWTTICILTKHALMLAIDAPSANPSDTPLGRSENGQVYISKFYLCYS